MTDRFTLGGKIEPGGMYGLGEVVGGPVPFGVVTTAFAVRDALHWTEHNGLDIANAEGTPVVSPPLPRTRVASKGTHTWDGPGTKTLFAGTSVEKVLQPGDPDRGGNYITLVHEGPWLLPSGETVANAFTIYCHLREVPSLAVASVVPPETVIGYMGSTGYSTGPHLHLMVAFDRARPGAYFPPPVSVEADVCDDPALFIGAPQTLPQGEVLPEPIVTPQAAMVGAAAAMYRFAVAGPDARTDVVEVPASRPGWLAWKVEVKQ